MVKNKRDSKEKIIKILSKSLKPVDVSIFVKKLGVNKTTIYRQIEKLIKTEVIVEVEFGDGKKRYELKSIGHHHHLVCNNCQTLEDIVIDERVVLSQINKKTKFKVESHNLEFFGLCKDCTEN